MQYIDFMNRGTIDTVHSNQLTALSGQAEIDYLLDVAHVVESYGEQDSSYVDVVTDDGATPTPGIDCFVRVLGTQSKGSLYKEFMNIVHNEPLETCEHIDSYTCVRCNVAKVAIQSDAHMICPQCGETNIYFDSGTQGMSYDQEVNSEINTSFAYKRINHFNEWLAQFQAKESTNIPQDIIDMVSNELKKSRITKTSDITQTKVKGYLKKLGFNKFYEHAPHITNLLNGHKPPTMTLDLEERLRTMFREIQVPFERNKPDGRSNFLSYSYCLYKFCELIGKDEFLGCFPLLKSREKLYQQDCIWKKICNDMNWEYIPTV